MDDERQHRALIGAWLARLGRQGEVHRKGTVLVIPKLEELAERYSAFLDTPLGLTIRAVNLVRTD